MWEGAAVGMGGGGRMAHSRPWRTMTGHLAQNSQKGFAQGQGSGGDTRVAMFVHCSLNRESLGNGVHFERADLRIEAQPLACAPLCRLLADC